MPTKPKQNSINFHALTWSHRDEIAELLSSGFPAIQEAFAARRIALDPNGEPVDLGPDYRAGFAALGTVIDLCTRGRKLIPQPKQNESREVPIDELWEIHYGAWAHEEEKKKRKEQEKNHGNGQTDRS